MSPAFSFKKAKILNQLAVPATEYADASPKGSVDAGIRDLIDEINALDGVVTTSSCAGRVSVYLEGQRKGKKKEKEKSGNKAKVKITLGKVEAEDDENENEDVGGERNPLLSSSAVGGKGGGEWLFVSHDPLLVTPSLYGAEGEAAGSGGGGGNGGAESWCSLFGLEDDDKNSLASSCAKLAVGGDGDSPRLIHFKFEPMILHVLTASHEIAQLVVQAGMEAGFRETGAVSLLPKSQSSEESATPMVAVRSMGLSFESLIGAEAADGRRSSIVSPGYLDLLVTISHERFAENQKRISRFREALTAAFARPGDKKKGGPEGWEDSETRRERKRQEGLRRKQELKQKGQERLAPPSKDLDVIIREQL